MENTNFDEDFRPPARVENESFRPSLSPTGDVFDDRKVDITTAIVSGLAGALSNDANNEAESSSESDEENKGDTVKKSPAMDENKVDEKPAEVGEQQQQQPPAEEQQAEDSKEKNDSEESEVKPPVVKSDSAGPIKDKQALIDDDDETIANGTSPANQFEIMEPSNTVTRRGSTSQKGVSGQLTKVKNFVKMWFGVLVCVILPIAVYVVDIIITTKVIESKGYKHAMVHWQDDTNKNNKPIPKMNTFGFDDYTLKETWFFELLEQSKQHEKRIVEENAKLMGFGNVIHGLHGHNWSSAKTSTKAVKTTTKPSTTVSTNATTTMAITEAELEESENDVRKRREDENDAAEEEKEEEVALEASDEEEKEETLEEAKDEKEKPKPKPKPKKPTKVTSETKHRSKVPKPTLTPEEEKKREEAKQDLAKQAEENKVLFEKYQKWRIEYMATKMEYNYGNDTVHTKFTMGGQKDGQSYHCHTLSYFYEQHQKWQEESKEGWFEDISSSVSQLQQVLFIVFTIVGFFLAIVSVALRADMWFKDEWSSFILGTFAPYIVSACLAAKIFLLETGRGGLRCFVCRLSTTCSDIDPSLSATNNYPGDFAWAKLVVASYIIKLIDCVIIGGTTLTFVMSKRDAIWASVVKFIGWIVVFPWLVATPLLGVYLYEVVESVTPDEQLAQIKPIVTGFFYTGAALWGVLVIAGPVFCKYRMCNNEENPLEKDDF